MIREYVFLGHDNSIDVILKSRRAEDDLPVAQDLAAVNKITLTVGDVLVSSTNQANDPIRWLQTGYDTGEVHISLGAQSLTPDTYRAPLVVYDTDHPEGIVWGFIPVEVLAEVEAG
jgi:hypothetical protein